MTIVRCVDTETTGLEPTAALVELAAVDINLETCELSCVIDTLIFSAIDIPPQASAVHHITKEMITEDYPTQTDAIAEIAGAPVYAAHNARFDRQFIKFDDANWICTYKCALSMWPDAPAHSNQTLRYWKSLKLDYMALKLSPHRALHDACVTAAILLEMAQTHSVDQMIGMSGRPALLTKLTFGKHANVKYADVELGYLEWMVKQDFEEDVMYTAKYWLGARRKGPDNPVCSHQYIEGQSDTGPYTYCLRCGERVAA